MIKKTDILGMHVDNYTVREAILQLDVYMNNTVLNVIETVTMQMLLQAADYEAVRRCIEEADLSVIAEQEILSETGLATPQRVREIKERDFQKELLKRVERNQKRVCLLAEKRAEADHVQDVFTQEYKKLIIAGSYALEECVGDFDSVVNAINGTTPDIVISALPMPMEAEFISEHKDKIGASVWYGAGVHCADNDRYPGGLLKRLFTRGRLHQSMNGYQNKIKDGK